MADFDESNLTGLRKGSPRKVVDQSLVSEQPESNSSSPWTGIALGLVGVAALSWIVPYVDTYLQASPLSSNYLPTGVFLAFLLVLGINTVLRLGPWALTRQQVMLAYITMLVPSAIPSEGLATRLMSTLVGLWYYASPSNEWQSLYPRYIPEWMTPTDQGAVTWFFEGLPEGQSIPWGVWVEPLMWWTLLIFSLYLILTTLTIMLRRQWMDSERLQYPLAQIPLTIMGDDKHPSWAGKFFRNRTMWIGAAIPFTFHFINGLHEYYPVVPIILPSGLTLSTLFSGAQMLRESPFDVLSGVEVNFYWSVTGISYLLRSEVSFSIWVFEWLYVLERVIFRASGLGDGTHQWSPLHTIGHSLASRYQKLGGIVLAAAFYMFMARGRIKELCLAAIGRKDSLSDEVAQEWWVAWGFGAGVIFFIGWLYMAGMSLLVAVSMLTLFLAMCIVTARVIAATGLLWVYDWFVPMHGVAKILGTARIDPQSFTIVGYVDFIALSPRANLMPLQGDSLKIAQMSRISSRHVLLGTALGILVACLVSYVAVLNLAYTHGGLNLQHGIFNGLQNWLWNRIANRQRYQLFTNWTVIGLMGGGGAVMGGMLYFHRHFLWWPLYPLMFLFGDTNASRQLWFPVFLGWLIKAAVTRSGGHRSYSKLKAAALGVILGEFIAVGFWIVIAALSGYIGHKVFPNFAPS